MILPILTQILLIIIILSYNGFDNKLLTLNNIDYNHLIANFID